MLMIPSRELCSKFELRANPSIWCTTTPSHLRSRSIGVREWDARPSPGGIEVEGIEREGGESTVDREGKRTTA
jgi:hypothetical protein